MKITVNNFLEATAKAMSKDEATALIKGVPGTLKMFTLFSTALLMELEDKDITEDNFDEVVDAILTEITPEKATELAMLKTLALLTFSTDIWENLKALTDGR